MKGLEEKTALVTGAGRGIGRAVAKKFAAEGARVICVSRTQANAEAVVAEIEGAGGVAQAVALDVADAGSVESIVGDLVKSTGGIDILVNNAGVTRDGLLMRMSESDWDTVLDTNLKGAFLMTKALTRMFLKKKSGSIINIASVIGLIGNAGQANYAASKAGLIGFTKSCAKEMASRGIRVNAIAPGFIQTDMTDGLNDDTKSAILNQIPIGEFGKVEDIAEAAYFLSSSAARYITGQVLVVDGGMVM
jgi:3-oxoacyl-[acyl-carrier protein] reductase